MDRAVFAGRSNGGTASAGEFNAVSVALSGDLGVGGAAQAGAASAELSQVSMLAGDSTSAKHSMAAITPHHNVIAKDVSEDCVWL